MYNMSHTLPSLGQYFSGQDGFSLIKPYSHRRMVAIVATRGRIQLYLNLARPEAKGCGVALGVWFLPTAVTRLCTEVFPLEALLAQMLAASCQVPAHVSSKAGRPIVLAYKPLAQGQKARERGGERERESERV